MSNRAGIDTAAAPLKELQQEVHALIEQCCLSQLTEPQGRRLDELLGAHAWARAAYLDSMAVEAELHASHAVAHQSAESSADDFSAASFSAANEDALLSSLSALPSGGESRRSRRVLSWLAIAASLLGVATASSWTTANLLRGDARAAVANSALGASDKAIDSNAFTIAEITATRNCRWRDATVGCGDEVYAGQRLDLLQGVAELLFPSGVTVLLEGPATLDFDEEGSLSMLSGRLCVDSPDDAESLQIKAGRMVLAQRGAACGVLTDNVGGGEVHVFRGEVQAMVLDAGGQRLQTCSLVGGAGGRLKPAARSFTPIQAHGDLFVRSLSPSTGPQDGLYAVETFEYPAGPLSEQNGGFGWAGPWAEIESMPGAGGESTNNVAERSLTWPGLPPRGAHFRQTGQANRVRRVLSTSSKGVFDVAGLVENRDAHRLIGKDGSTVYVSVLQRVSKLDDVFYGLELNRGDGNGNRVLCVGNGAEGARYAVTSNYNFDNNVAEIGPENTEVNLIVIRIDYGADDHDRAIVYRNPRSLVDEFKCRPAAELTGNFSFDRISFGNFEGTKHHEVDDLRIGTSFRVVTGQRSFLQAPLADGSRRRLDWLAGGFGPRQADARLAAVGRRFDFLGQNLFDN
ncbi:MAG: hypothetical protein AAF589_04110 [Planctomycetota bacterium]